MAITHQDARQNCIWHFYGHLQNVDLPRSRKLPVHGVRGTQMDTPNRYMCIVMVFILGGTCFSVQATSPQPSFSNFILNLYKPGVHKWGPHLCRCFGLGYRIFVGGVQQHYRTAHNSLSDEMFPHNIWSPILQHSLVKCNWFLMLANILECLGTVLSTSFSGQYDTV